MPDVNTVMPTAEELAELSSYLNDPKNRIFRHRNYKKAGDNKCQISNLIN